MSHSNPIPASNSRHLTRTRHILHYVFLSQFTLIVSTDILAIRCIVPVIVIADFKLRSAMFSCSHRMSPSKLQSAHAQL